MYFKREIKSSKIGTKFIPALKYGAFFGFSRKRVHKSASPSVEDSGSEKDIMDTKNVNV